MLLESLNGFRKETLNESRSSIVVLSFIMQKPYVLIMKYKHIWLLHYEKNSSECQITVQAGVLYRKFTCLLSVSCVCCDRVQYVQE